MLLVTSDNSVNWEQLSLKQIQYPISKIFVVLDIDWIVENFIHRICILKTITEKALVGSIWESYFTLEKSLVDLDFNCE